MLKNLRIGVRLSLLVALLCAAQVAVGLIGLHGMRAGNDALDSIYNDRVVPLRDLKVIADMYAVNVVDSAHKARAGTLAPEAAVEAIDEARATIRRTWQEYLGTYLVEEEQRLVAEIEPLMAAADQATMQLRGLLAAGDAAGLADFAAHRLYPAIDPVSAKLQELIEVQLTAARRHYAENDALYERTWQAMAALIGLALLVALGAGYAIIRSITRPMAQASALLAGLAEGRLDAQVADDGRRDETGRMIRATADIARTLQAVNKDLSELIGAAKAGALSVRAAPEQHRGDFAALVAGANELVEVLTAPLFEIAAVTARLAAGDVSGRMTGSYNGDLRALKGNVNRSLDTLVGLLDEVSAFAAGLARGDITVTIDGAYQGDFAALKANLGTAADQLARVVREVRRSTGEVATAAGDTAAASTDVSRQAAGQLGLLTDVAAALGQTVAAIGEIARSAERGNALASGTLAIAAEGQARLASLSAAVDGIAAANARIGQISARIADIADKTYVLAINTGLEAIRAGEQGRGFGLIATQITGLAEEAAQATRDIRGLVEESGRTVQEGVATAAEASRSMQRVVEASRENGATAQAIAAATEEQSATVRLLDERLGGLQMAGQSTASAAEQISATMRSLTELARHLKAESDRLHVAA